MSDSLTRFVLDSAPVRGGIVRLSRAYSDVVDHHGYTATVRHALGEMLSVSTLIASSMKWQGSLIVQMQGSGALQLLCVESTHSLDVRGVATADATLPIDATLATLMPAGRVVITLDPHGMGENAQMYQGIVALNPRGIAATMEDYMLQSQQVQTCIVLAADASRAAGMLVQKLPGDDHQSFNDYERAVALTRTLSAEELLSLDADTILTRLFHEERVRVLPSQSVRAHCPCTSERVVGALRLIGWAEVDAILNERGEVEAHCQFCNKRYAFGRPALEALFARFNDVEATRSKH